MSDDEDERVSERDELVQEGSELLAVIKQRTARLAAVLLRLDEIGQPVTRCRGRCGKIEEARFDLQSHFDFDLVQRKGKQTKDQKTRAERYELS